MVVLHDLCLLVKEIVLSNGVPLKNIDDTFNLFLYLCLLVKEIVLSNVVPSKMPMILSICFHSKILGWHRW